MTKNITSLINRTRVKKLILAIANDKHSCSDEAPDTRVDTNGRIWQMARSNKLMAGKKFTQVGLDLLDEIDSSVRQLLKDRIEKTPQVGKTVR